jgi:hypothetical protein
MAEENFYLSSFNVVVDSGLASMSGADTTTFTGDATASVTIPQDIIQSLFQFSSDSIDVNNTASTDILYKISYTTNAEPLGLDIDTDASVIVNPIHSGAADNNLTYDFVRYLAVQLFNHHNGVDLFNNETELRNDLNTAFKTEFNTVLINLAGEGVTDSTGSSPAKSVLSQIIDNQPSRLQDITPYYIETDENGHPWYKMPVLENDVVYFTLQVNPAANQEDLTGLVNPINARTYLIKATISAPTNV